MMMAAAAAPQLALPPAVAAAVRAAAGEQSKLGSKVRAEHCQVHLRVAGRLLEAVRLKKCAFAQSTMVHVYHGTDGTTARVLLFFPSKHPFCPAHPLHDVHPRQLASFATYPDDSNTYGTLPSSQSRRQVHDQLPSIRPLPLLSASPPAWYEYPAPCVADSSPLTPLVSLWVHVTVTSKASG
jgi:hypothetical protein